MTRALPMIPVLAILLFVAPAFGHGLDEPLGADAALFVGDELVGVGTNYGLLTPTSDGAWAWTPEEILDAEIRAWRALDETTFEVGTTDGVYRSADGGCSWEPFGLQGVVVSAFAQSRCESTVHLAAVESATGAGGVYRYGDEGWVRAGLGGEDILVSALSCWENDCVAGGFVRGTGAAIWRSADCGWTWTAVELALDDTIRAVGIDPASRVVIAVRDGEGTRWFELSESDAVIDDGALESAVTSIAAEPFHVWHAVDDDETEWLLPGEPVDMGVRSVRSESVGTVRCADRSRGDMHVELRGRDGALMTFAPFATVRPAVCLEGSYGARWVEALWPVIRELGVGTADAPPGASEPDVDGCGCSGAKSRSGWAAPMVMLLVGLLRRSSSARCRSCATSTRER